VRSTGNERQASEERLRSEMQRLREMSSKEIEDIKTGLKDSYEREVRSLKDAKEEAVIRAERLQDRLDAQQAQSEAAAANRKDQRDQTLTAAAELRGLLNVKAAEVERLTLTNAEQADAIKRLTREVDSLRERLALVSADVTKKEAEADKLRTSLETALEAERAKVSLYERLEAELDTAIIAAGRGEGTNAEVAAALLDNNNGEEGASGDQLFRSSLGLTLASGIPTTSRRRLRQTITLARELSRAQKDVAALKKQLYELQRRQEATEDEASRLRIALDGVQGPPEFLVWQLRAQEVEIKQLRGQLDDHKAQIAGLKRTLTDVDSARQAAEGEVRKLSASRQDVQGITALVSEALYLRQHQQQQSQQLPPAPSFSQHQHQQQQHFQYQHHAVRGGGPGSAASSVSLKSADLAMPTPVHGHGGHHNHHHHHHNHSGISTPLDTASTRSTPPKHTGDSEHRTAAAVEPSAAAGAAARSSSYAAWDLGTGVIPVDTSSSSSSSAVLQATARTRKGGNHSGSGGDASFLLTAAEMPLAGGIRYTAGSSMSTNPLRQPSLQKQQQPSSSSGAPASSGTPAVSFSPQEDKPGSRGSAGGSGVTDENAMKAGMSVIKAVDPPTAGGHIVSSAAAAALSAPTTQQSRRQQPEVAHFAAASAAASPVTSVASFHQRRRK
jgi:hypothetical protein